MPIINSVISAGKIPTGTLPITSNGIVDVTNYASASVQVPTTAPDYYIEKAKNSSNELISGSTFINLSGITSIGNYGLAGGYCGSTVSGNIDMSSIVSIKNYGCYVSFLNSTNITGVDLSSLETVYDYGLYQAFENCSGITSVNLSSLTTVNQYGMYHSFYNCSNLTGLLDLSSLTTVNQYGMNYAFASTKITGLDISSLTTVNNYGMYYAFYYCKNLTGNIDLSNITGAGVSAFMYAFSGTSITSIKGCSSRTADYQCMCYPCTSLISADLSGFVDATGSRLWNTFQGCSNLISADLSNVEIFDSSWSAANCFLGCSSLTSFHWYSLRTAKSNHCIEKTFQGCTSLTDVYFPALNSNSFSTQHNIFDNMLYGVTGCTVHFPSNLQSVLSSWANIQNGMGGTQTTILYDLPATVILAGIDMIQYQRNPKCDTATALGWRIKDTYAIDAVPYYTSGTADPQVGDTIYSDSACTIAVTTIDSIS